MAWGPGWGVGVRTLGFRRDLAGGLCALALEQLADAWSAWSGLQAPRGPLPQKGPSPLRNRALSPSPAVVGWSTLRCSEKREGEAFAGQLGKVNTDDKIRFIDV